MCRDSGEVSFSPEDLVMTFRLKDMRSKLFFFKVNIYTYEVFTIRSIACIFLNKYELQVALRNTLNKS